MLERRDVIGGACVTEELWPGRRVSRASYVVSMLQPKVVKELELHRFGYEAIPLDPAFGTIAGDGRALFTFTDSAATQASLRPHSPHDAAAYPAFEELLERCAGFLRPLMLRPPPAIGSKRPGDLFSLLREAGRAAGMSRRDLLELFRVMTMSVGDLLDEHFESDVLKGAFASTGVVGVWAGPRTPGTAYNLLHHALGELNGIGGLWGHVKGGMGGISNAIARSGEASGAVIRTGAGVASVDVTGGRVTGVTLSSGEQLRAPLVVSGAHPRTTVLDMVGAEHFPDEVVTDMRRFRSRGGSVKVNWILSEPPRFEGVSDEDGRQLLHTSLALCPSIDYLERAWQDAVRGVPAEGPYVEVEVPTSVDPSLTDDGTTVMTMFTQYGPVARGGLGRGRARGLRPALPRHRGPPRAQRARRGDRPRGAGPAGSRAHLRPPGRIDLPGRAGPRADGLHAPRADAGAVRDPGRRALSVRRRHPPRRRGDGGLRAQRRTADPQGPPARGAPAAGRAAQALGRRRRRIGLI